MRKAKLSLIASIAVGLLAITTAGVSTWAWFEANANATVSGTNNNSTLLVSKPDDYVFYSYRGNRTYDYVPENEGNDFDDDFIPITSDEALAAETDLTGIYPGQNLTFAIRITNIASASLKINKIKSNDSTMEGISRDRVVWQNTTKKINIGWAINIHSTFLTTTTGYSSYVNDPSTGSADKFLYDELDGVPAHSRANYLAASSTTDNVITLSTPIEIFNSSSLNGSGDTYIFYSVVFSNSNTTFFQEMASNSGSADEVDIPPSGAGARYFKKVTTGNSNCYGGLSFALTELELVM